MSKRLVPWAIVLTGVLFGAAPRSADPGTLLAEADAALARGDYARAEQLFERAEPRATDPGRVALGLATAKYRLALQTPARAALLLSQAEALYRCCLDADYPNRPLALVGLGNCLVRESASRDAAAAAAAAERYTEAEHDRADADLADVARHNRLRALLLARQIATAPPEKSDRPPPGDDPERDRKPPESSPPQAQDAADRGDGKKSGVRASKADAGQVATETDDAPSPGKGPLPPVPDRDGLPPLTPSQAREHLEQAARRVIEEARQHRRGSVRPAAAGVPDW
jgi:tetratricopeptide (TPR) repeat protein